MREKLKQITERLAALVSEERSQLDRIKAESREFDATEQEQYEKRAAEIDKLETERQKVVSLMERDERNARLAADLERPIGEPERPSGERESDARQQEIREAFRRFCWTGETRGLEASDDKKGGFLAPKEFVNELIKDLVEVSPIRQLARVRATSMRSVMWPRKTSTISATWSGETSTRSEATGMAFGTEEIQTNEMTAVVKVSNQMLEDADFNVEQFIRDEISEQFAYAEAVAFVTGNGVAKPWGITTDTLATDTNSGSNGDFDADDLIDIKFSLKDAYDMNGVWLLNRTTAKKIRKLKINNEYIWMPFGQNVGQLVQGVGPTILDRPYRIIQAMPSTGTTGNISIVYGDIRRAYTVIDRLAMGMLRDPYTAASTNEVVFWARKRVGGGLVLGEAIARLKESA